MLAVLAADTSWTLIVVYLLSIPTLVALNGLFVAAEFSLVAVRGTRIEEMIQQGIAGAKSVESATNNLDQSIAATQLGITLSSIALGFVGEPVLARLIEPVFAGLPLSWRFAATHTVATVSAFLLITFLHVVFGELIPKTVALQIPDKTALWIAKPLLVFSWLSRPLIATMNGTGNAILRAFRFDVSAHAAEIHSLEELRLLIEDQEEAGFLEPGQAEYVQNVFELKDRKVIDCMVPKEKMASLEVGTPPDKILEAVRAGGHTRMPVYEGELDNLLGIVNTKDLFYLFSLQGVVILHDALYPPLFLDAEETIGNALLMFRRIKRHMAIVRDGDGKILGLITLEDILEEIVGELEDEHDHPRHRWVRRVAVQSKKKPEED